HAPLAALDRRLEVAAADARLQDRRVVAVEVRGVQPYRVRRAEQRELAHQRGDAVAEEPEIGAAEMRLRMPFDVKEVLVAQMRVEGLDARADRSGVDRDVRLSAFGRGVDDDE